MLTCLNPLYIILSSFLLNRVLLHKLSRPGGLYRTACISISSPSLSAGVVRGVVRVVVRGVAWIVVKGV